MRDDEPQLLDRLTRLAGQVESQHAAIHRVFRPAPPTLSWWTNALKTLPSRAWPACRPLVNLWSGASPRAQHLRLVQPPARCAVATGFAHQRNLLRTRVEIEQQQSSQALLATMNSRQGMQLKLQSTVEGLSVAAITYYIVGLASYLAKGAQHWGWPWSPEMTAAAAIPGGGGQRLVVFAPPAPPGVSGVIGKSMWLIGSINPKHGPEPLSGAMLAAVC